MSKTGDERVSPILFKAGGELGDGIVKDCQVSTTDSLCDLHVGSKFGDHSLGEEYVAFGYFTHEELNYDEETLGSNTKSESRVGRCFAETLGEVGECGCILEAESLDTTGVV